MVRSLSIAVIASALLCGCASTESADRKREADRAAIRLTQAQQQREELKVRADGLQRTNDRLTAELRETQLKLAQAEAQLRADTARSKSPPAPAAPAAPQQP
jgi:septal ring factor EnvC (AmiA/AmiB activator)